VSRRGAASRTTRAATLALIAAAALPAAASAGPVRPVSVTRSTDVPAGEARSLTLRCPAKAVALNASATTELADSIPGGNARTWTFRFAAENAARTGRAILRCVRMRLPKGVGRISLVVETRIEPVLEMSPDDTQRLRITCSRGMVPTGWGLERIGEDNGLAIADAMPTRRGWAFTVENAGSAGASGALHVRCLERTQRARTGERHAFSTRVASFTERLEGPGTTRRACRRSEFSLSTGVSLPASDDILLTASGPVGRRGGEWTFAQPAGTVGVRTSIVCLAKDTRFRG
jgi:hypothetical protein